MSEQNPSIESLFKLAAQNLQEKFEKIRLGMPHYPTSGTETERLLIEVLNDHMPKRFAATSGFVLDIDDSLSKQCDVLVYDAENSPVYRTGPTTLILPSDSIAAVVEVKSTLNKAELEDAAAKIASVKKLKRSPLSNIDQPVNFSNFIVNNSLGVVFAYQSDTSLQTLATNLKEINAKSPRPHWIDVVVVLGKGMIGYCMEFPGEGRFRGILMPESSNDFRIPACYVNLCIFEDAEYVFHRFFSHLMYMLTFYRKRTTLPLNNLFKNAHNTVTPIQCYWYTCDRNLVEVPNSHIGKGEDLLLEFDIFEKQSNRWIGQFGQCKWSDGYIYEVVPPNQETLQALSLIIAQTKQMNNSLTPRRDGLVAYSSLLKGAPPSFEEIAKAFFYTPFEVRKAH